MAALKTKKLDLKIVPALIPTIIGASVTLLIVGKQIGVVITALVSGYFAFLAASILVEWIRLLKRKKPE